MASVSECSVALVVGVTGIVGFALAEALKKPTARGGPWRVYGSARRPTPDWFPPFLLDGFIQFDTLDRDDTTARLSPVAHQVTHLFWVALKLCPDEEVNIKTNSTMLSNVLEVLTGSPSGSSLRHVTIQTGTKHYMGPIGDPTHAARLGSVEPPWREDTPRRPFPNFYYALEDVAASYSPKITWSVHRSSIILGASSRSLHNMLLTLAVYAEICRYKQTPFRFPGSRYTWEHFCDASDAQLLAEQQIWAATTDTANNQAFNCTNGDVYTWKSFWRVVAEALKVEFVPYDDKEEPFDWVEDMKGKGAVWDTVVKLNGLCETKMEEITCFNAANLVFNFGFQHVCSMNKSREFGFLTNVDTLKSIPAWIEKMREMNLIPRR
ncbi:(S)-8-oxocitronellyl enol synthase CYC2-like [Aristolochia californica]|uniref:(S)-8-oxocitronellyl enol synthase CYC2-like n=1 Tax=Aristolochia californica TaxID=171875 RepID=UPI0035D5547D